MGSYIASEPDFVKKYPVLAASIKREIPEGFQFRQAIDEFVPNVEVYYVNTNDEDSSILFESSSPATGQYSTDGVETD